MIARFQAALTAAWLAMAAAALSGCGGEGITIRANVTRTLAEDGRFTELSRALVGTGLDARLANESQTFTVFAPTDSAFAALGEEVAEALVADPELLLDLLLYHLLLGAELDSAAITASAGGRLTTASGEDIALSLRSGQLYINDARLVVSDIQASNGVIHALDTVLIPGAPVTGLGTVAELIAADPRLTTFTGLLQSTGIMSAFEDERGSFTLFAPTDAAFAALPADVLAALETDPWILAPLLLNHFLTNQAVDAETLRTFAGTELQLSGDLGVMLELEADNLRIGNAQLVEADIAADNGVVHIIDAVLVP